MRLADLVGGVAVMSDFEAYMLAQARCEKATATYNWAASDLRNAQIGKRLTEIKSQHEPLNTLLQAALSERDRMYAAAYYVVVGRLPEQQK